MPADPSCTKCKLHKDARNVCTWGRQVGSTAPEIMIVGRSPDAQSDQQGRPFAGRLGEFLRDALEKVGITDYYLTDIVKCFSNGEPSSTEISQCRSFLDEEIRTIRPRCILALGNAAWHFFGSGPISEHAGRESRSSQYDCWVMPLLHPAAVLRDPSRERSWRADLSRFAHLVRGQLIEKPPVTTYLLGGSGWVVLQRP